MTPIEKRLAAEIDAAEAEAWNCLARYKGQGFGYWFGVWVHLNRIEGNKRPNPWRQLVHVAREHLGRDRHSPTAAMRPRSASLLIAPQTIGVNADGKEQTQLALDAGGPQEDARPRGRKAVRPPRRKGTRPQHRLGQVQGDA